MIDLDYFCNKLRELETPEQRREFIDVFGDYAIVDAAQQREESQPTSEKASS